jgi:2-polyprenyl-6-methoxyphenol hydroxylase-like FAD-dependent oxidoreductase
MITHASCCIVGAGPAGVMLALLLARKGIDVTLLELHKDLDRDFRGDTVHASTLEVLDQIGLADAALALSHTKMRSVTLHTRDRSIPMVDFSRLKTRFPYVMITPQVMFLNFLCDEAGRYPNFRRVLGAGVQELITTEQRVTGVRYKHDGEVHELQADIVIAADGRFSTVRKLAKLTATSLTPPMDVCWLRLPRQPADGHETGGFFIGSGRMLILLPRPDEWQIGYVFPKGDFKAVRELGLDAFRTSVGEIVPWLSERASAIADWDALHLLSVSSDCLEHWHRPGLLFVGDAAHVMSPVGGIGINAAIGDAVEAANVLIEPLKSGAAIDEALLAEIQARRKRITATIQTVQARIQDTIVKRAIRNQEFDLPLPIKLALRVPGLRDLPPKIFALGLKPLRLENQAI